MGLFTKLQISGIPTIDWEMTPEYTFGTFESWGGVERIRSKNERTYYFFIDGWEDDPKLCLMERGIKHARVVAEILAPEEMVRECVAQQGKVAMFERTHAINDKLKQWLLKNVVESDDSSLVIPLVDEKEETLKASGLPSAKTHKAGMDAVVLPSEPAELSEEDIVALVKRYSLVDHERNPDGTYEAELVDNEDDLTVTDLRSGLMWQREGVDITSNRGLRKEVSRLNSEHFAGYDDWRVPTLAEALSLMRREKNSKDQYIHACFSAAQPFIFADAVRSPGGYWFVDFKQGRAFWASGTIPGGFGRLCRRKK
ncbi:Lcl C-terminal domain-containing protein [Desulfogranum japonicum]|uniref:Lcl C-terminal domain-containing protein n=1 Tax=Desulfogranum japonicum TaxID=231447 RepID=UPI00041B0B93|nr:DUF1566 domain-containing protein [Desulfogranum japonicum]